MKPDAFMPFYGNDFFQAVQGHTDSVAASYLRAIWYYWSHNHCKGLEDNDEFLRRVCYCDKEHWSYVRGVLFDNDHFFSQDVNGRWHQKRAEEEWNKSESSYARAVAGGKNRWKGLSQAERTKVGKLGGRPKKNK
jgi:uncharacterized protein YdaU (DUF1376 family)